MSVCVVGIVSIDSKRGRLQRRKSCQISENDRLARSNAGLLHASRMSQTGNARQIVADHGEAYRDPELTDVRVGLSLILGACIARFPQGVDRAIPAFFVGKKRRWIWVWHIFATERPPEMLHHNSLETANVIARIPHFKR